MNNFLEDKVRELLTRAECGLRWAKPQLEAEEMEDSAIYMNTIKSLILINELRDFLGYKEPPTKLKQTKIPYNG